MAHQKSHRISSEQFSFELCDNSGNKGVTKGWGIQSVRTEPLIPGNKGVTQGWGIQSVRTEPLILFLLKLNNKLPKCCLLIFLLAVNNTDVEMEVTQEEERPKDSHTVSTLYSRDKIT